MADELTFQTTPATLPSGTKAKLLQEVTTGDWWPGGWLAYPTTTSTNANVFQIVDATHGLPTVLTAAEVHAGQVGGELATPSANFTRPSDTTAYASGDLVANSTSSGSITPLSWTASRVAAGSFCVRRCRVKKSGTTITLASFRLHLYAASPTVSNGDNGAWLSTQSSYLGSLDVTIDKVFSDASEGIGSPLVGSEIAVKLASGSTIYGLLEARAAYTPASAEVFTVELEILQN